MGSGITYRNYYCAVCNDDSAADLRFWQPRLECPTLTGYNSRFKNLTAEFMKESRLVSKLFMRLSVSINEPGREQIKLLCRVP